MVATLESNPTSLLDKKSITLEELIIFELLLEIDTLDKKFGENWAPLASRITELNLKIYLDQLTMMNILKFCRYGNKLLNGLYMIKF